MGVPLSRAAFAVRGTVGAVLSQLELFTQVEGFLPKPLRQRSPRAAAGRPALEPTPPRSTCCASWPGTLADLAAPAPGDLPHDEVRATSSPVLRCCLSLCASRSILNVSTFGCPLAMAAIGALIACALPSLDAADHDGRLVGYLDRRTPGGNALSLLQPAAADA